jgi:eukaryotic-like serine/threonine-protein kinase
MTAKIDANPSTPGTEELYRFDSFTVDVRSRKLLSAGTPLNLPSRVFDLLVHFVRNHDQVVDKDALIHVGWADAFVSEDSLIHGISVLRRALGDDPSSPRFIITLPRRGYQFVGPVERLSMPLAAPVKSEPPPPAHEPPGRSPSRATIWAFAGVIAIALTVTTILGGQERRPSVPWPGVIRLAQVAPPGTQLVSGGMLSPDGRQMAFIARDRASGRDSLWVQQLGSSEPSAVAGTEGASKPFWSPDSDALGFFIGNSLHVVPLNGETARVVAALIAVPGGAAWGPADTILFADTGRGIFVTTAAGGQARQLTTVDPGDEISHAWPQFLPDGKRFLFSVTSMNQQRVGTWVASTDGSHAASLLLPGRIGGVYSPSGHLLYVRHGTLFAEPFDPSTLKLIESAAFVVARNVPEPRLSSAEPVSASGAVVSFKTAAKPPQLTWFDRSGRRTGKVQTPTSVHNPALSADEHLLAVTGLPSNAPGLWLIDLARNASTLLKGDGIGPVISPDDRQLAFTTRGGIEIRVRNVSGPATEYLLFQDDRRKVLQDWSPDGRYLVFSTMQPGAGLDLWMLPTSAGTKPTPLIATPANERQARISRDGRWLAYVSDESGAWEVYVQELPGLGSKTALSIGGGAGPAWANDGRELLYLSTDKRLMSVEFGADGPRSPTKPVPLFSVPLSGEVWDARNYYVVNRTGDRFLFNAIEETEGIPITVMVNWLAATNAPK